MEVVGWEQQNENPSTENIGPAAPSDSRRSRLHRDVFRAAGGGKVGGVQANKSPGFPTQYVCVQSHGFVGNTSMSLGDHLIDLCLRFLPPRWAAATTPRLPESDICSRPEYSYIPLTNKRGSQTNSSTKDKRGDVNEKGE
jgi:hypothetical protein